jgi:epoxyqueuosine reductase
MTAALTSGITAITAGEVKRIARECGFELAGIAPAAPAPDYARYREWVGAGMAGEMGYLTDHRSGLRADPRNLLPGAKTILCVGKLYNSPYPYSTEFSESDCGWISRYAWGDDYHDVLRSGLERVAERLHTASAAEFGHRICVDTAPLLERSYARLAGLGWIGRNTCLINEGRGSWFFLGELLLTLDLATDEPPPDRCGTCRRCIDACPTTAIVPKPDGTWTLDARLCISYLTIEKRGPIDPNQHGATGPHVFGCDICQDVCPWNIKAHYTSDEAFHPKQFAPPLEKLAALTPDQFRKMFRHTPVWRSKYSGFLRNVAIAMGNSGDPRFTSALERLAGDGDAAISQAAQQALSLARNLTQLGE